MHSCPCGDPAKEANNKRARCAALETFDLKSSATKQDIEDAYRTFAKLWQPDPFQRDEKLKKVAEAKLKAINAAYSVLTSAPAESDLSGEGEQAVSVETISAPERSGSFGERCQRFIGALPRPSKLMAIAALIAGLCVAGFLWKGIDSYLTGEPVVGEQYSNLKTFLRVRLREKTQGSWSDEWHQLFSHESATVAAASPQPDSTEQSDRQDRTPHIEHRYESNAVQPGHVKAIPYITADLTKAEVIAIQGTPTTFSEDKLTYAKTEFYFSDDKLAGWKIDPASGPARVKLWPQGTVDPSLQSFTLGSTKDQVIALQGTPTVFSEDTFGYGGSEVYFQNDQVIGWKDDRTSVPLRATAR
jgi:hypothetical protein